MANVHKAGPRSKADIEKKSILHIHPSGLLSFHKTRRRTTSDIRAPLTIDEHSNTTSYSSIDSITILNVSNLPVQNLPIITAIQKLDIK